MPRPRLSAAITWQRFEEAVLAVFREALSRLARRAELPRAEELINLQLYWIAREVHLELLESATGSIPFSILFDSTSQPEPDDVARASRLRKRPDFNCVVTNPQARSHLTSQVNYYLECKRLGEAEGTWVLNENYSEHGMNRFVHVDWQYAKGCLSGTMVGYIQNMDPNAILTEVNAYARTRRLPSLIQAAADWAVRDVTQLYSTSLTRTFQPNVFSLGHLWVDIRHIPLSPQPALPTSPTRPRKGPRRGQPGKGVIKR